MLNWKWMTPRMEGEGGASAPSGGGGEPAAPQAPSVPAQTGAPSNPPTDQTAPVRPTSNPLLRDLPGSQQAAPVAPAAPVIPAAAPPAPQPIELDFGGRKISVSDPAVIAALQSGGVIDALQGVHTDYRNLQGTYTQQQQRLKDLEQRQAAPPVTPPAAQEPPAPAAPTAPELTNEEWMDKFYENPKAAMAEFVDQMFAQKVEPVIKPIQEQAEIAASVKQMRETYADFDQVAPAMTELLAEIPELSQRGVEGLYQIAKQRMEQAQPPAAPTPPPPAPEQFLNDPAFLEQHVLNNPELQKRFLQQHLATLTQSQQQVPPSMGTGIPPLVGEKRPGTIKEASKAFRDFLARN